MAKISTMREIAVPFRLRGGDVQWTDHPVKIHTQHLYALFATWDGERVMERDYGGPFRDPLFDPEIPSTVSHLIELIQRSIARYNPEIEVQDIRRDTETDYTEQFGPWSTVIPLIILFSIRGSPGDVQRMQILSVDGRLQEVG